MKTPRALLGTPRSYDPRSGRAGVRTVGRILTVSLAVLLLAAITPRPAHLQTGLQIAGIPAVNFDSDEGFGYGVAGALYHYGDGSSPPYRWSLQPTVFLTTRGRRDYTVFFDAPSLVGAWRLDVFAGSQRQVATPYYGPGNEAVYEPDRVTDSNPYYYRFGRKLNSVLVNLQHPVGDLPLRILMGAGVIRGTLDPIPEARGTTLVAEEIAAGARPGVEGWINHVRAGLIWDTRDREAAPARGTWSDLVVQRIDEILGSEVGYTRWTLTDRRYWRLGPLVLVNRLLLQGITEEVPLVDLHRLQSSFRDQEGLGGARSLRGLLRNRYAGRGMFVWNTEVRWRTFGFEFWRRSFHLAVSAFLDQGRVWAGQPRPAGLLSDLHRGLGGGVRLGMGPDFVVGADVGTSSETGLQLYVGAGWLF